MGDKEAHPNPQNKHRKASCYTDLTLESISQFWYSQALRALPKYSPFLGSSIPEEVIQDTATPSEGLSPMTTFLSKWGGSVPVYLERSVQSSIVSRYLPHQQWRRWQPPISL